MTRTIGEAIEGRLHEMKIKPEELATVLDVPLPTLSGWLWLENDIPAQYILKIAHVLRCTPTYLLSGGEDDRETPTKSDAIEDLIRATVAEVLRQQEAQKRRGDTEPQMRTATYIERQREQLEQIRAEQAAEHGDPIRAMFYRMGAELLGDEITAQGVNAGVVVREAAKLMQGGGGGQNFFATAGGKNADGLQAAIDKAVELICNQLN